MATNDPVAERHAAALDAADLGVWDWDVVSGVLSWDERIAAIHGIELAGFDGSIEGFFERVHADDLPAVQSAIQQALAHGGPFVTEFRVVADDGPARWVQGRGRAVTDADGQVVRMIGVGIDTTSLTDPREQVARTLEHVRDGILVFDPGWRVTFANSEAARLVGRDPDVLVGADIWEQFPEAVGGIFWTSYHEAMTSQEPCTFEAYYGPVHGWFEVRAFPAPDTLTVYFRDINAERAAAAEREHLIAEQSRLYQRQRTVTDALQQAVLPDRLPAVAGIELAARYVPAEAGAAIDVGGDWYDAFVLPGGGLAIAVGDVTGHGLEAAAVMGQLRNALRAYAWDGYEPAEVMGALDRLLSANATGLYATAVYAVLEEGRLRYTVAGHPPLLVASPDAPARLLSGTPDCLLGIGGNRYREWSEDLRPDDILFAYTDGLIEHRTSTLADGFDRLVRLAGRAVSHDLEAFCDFLITSVPEKLGRDDDICVLAVRAGDGPGPTA